jgi:predicted amidohydrolase
MKNLCSLLFETTKDYEKNLQTLLRLIEQTQEESLVVAPEVCLTGFDYENWDAAVAFNEVATAELLQASHNKIIILTMLEKVDGTVFNNATVFHNGKIVFKRAKARLFRLGAEHKYMAEGSDKDCQIFEIDGVKIAILICFELRFKELLVKIEGADVIVTPSWWGEPRTEHFKALTQTLAILNECYVVASDSLNDECTKMSGIITPNGVVKRNGNRACLEVEYNKKDIAFMRRYLDIGIE